MSKKAIRTVHIEKEEWKWVVKPGNFGEAVNVNIYSPDKKLYRINPKNLTDETMYVGLEGELPTKITPARIKKYIIEQIKNNLK